MQLNPSEISELIKDKIKNIEWFELLRRLKGYIERSSRMDMQDWDFGKAMKAMQIINGRFLFEPLGFLKTINRLLAFVIFILFIACAYAVKL